MDALASALLNDPLYYIGALLAFVGALGFLTFLRGFLGGVGNLFHMHGHDDHLHHARVEVMQGILVMMACLGIWEVIRVVLGQAPGSTIIYALILLIPVWIPLLKSLFNGGGGGGH